MDVKGAIDNLKAWIDENESGPFHKLVHDVLEAIGIHVGALPAPAPAPVAPTSGGEPAVADAPAVSAPTAAPAPAEASTDVGAP